MTQGTLKDTEPHPSSEIARRYLISVLFKDEKRLWILRESLASCALAGNREAEVCGETLERLINKQPVSDRYFMGLAWFIWSLEQIQSKQKPSTKKQKATAEKIVKRRK